MKIRHSESGSAAVVATGVLVALTVLTLLALAAAATFRDHARAQTAADFAALTAAHQYQRQRVSQDLGQDQALASPCREADRVATANGLQLASCQMVGQDAIVQVVGGAHFFGLLQIGAKARAGP